MKLEGTCYANHFLVINENNIPVGVQINGEVAFQLHDTVKVSSDARGYICPGISSEGVGTIVEIRKDDTDHFYGVKMMNGEFGYMKHLRMEHLKTNF